MLSQFELIPTEIQVLLLSHLDSITTLFSLLRASPRILQVYRTHRDVVYPNIVYNQITPSLIQDAVVTLRLRDLKWASDVSVFTQTFYQSVDYSKIPMTDWKRLLKFQNIVDKTTRNVTETTLQDLHARMALKGLSHSTISLSHCEHHRMARAFYNRELLASIYSHHLHAAEEILTDAEEYSEFLGSFLSTWALNNFEEVFFVNHQLRKHLVRFVDQAEDDRYEEWTANGPYKWRYDFENNEDWAWSRAMRDELPNWVSNTLYGTDLAVVDQIINEIVPIARIERIEASQRDWGTREHWTQLEQQLQHGRSLAVQQLASRLLPHEWRSCTMPEMDFNTCHFVDTANDPNIGLLWGCRKSGVFRPSFSLLDGMAVWGAAIWDSERLQQLGILANDPDHVRGHEVYYWSGSLERQKPSVEERVSHIEESWVAQKLTPNRWNHDYNPTGRYVPTYLSDEEYPM